MSPTNPTPSEAIDKPQEIPAGPFGAWLAAMQACLHGDAGTDVPCGDCVGCCVSSYFIPVRPQDKGALARIPPELLMRTRHNGDTNVVLGYRDDGTCPMLAGGTDKEVINRRVRAWRFVFEDEAARRAYDAIRTAASFIRDKKARFPGGRAPSSPTGIAVLALKAHEVFLDPDWRLFSDTEIAERILAAGRAFDSAGSS
jgi:hypothetical protein